MNKVILIGRLTRDPDVRYSNNGDNQLAIARYTLAVDRRFAKRDNADAQTADFISCVAFGRSGEFAEKYLHQGTKICVEGRIQTGSYTNKEGNKVYTTEVVVENHEFVESKAASDGRRDGAPASAPAPAPAAAPAQNTESQSAPADGSTPADEGFINVPEGIENELPF